MTYRLSRRTFSLECCSESWPIGGRPFLVFYRGRQSDKSGPRGFAVLSVALASTTPTMTAVHAGITTPDSVSRLGRHSWALTRRR